MDPVLHWNRTVEIGIPVTTGLLIHSLKGKTSKGIALFGTAIITDSVAIILKVKLLLVKTPYLLPRVSYPALHWQSLV